jgi:hypothetical protein
MENQVPRFGVYLLWLWLWLWLWLGWVIAS